MTKKILCPTDGSDHATLGVHKAVELARLTGAQLTVCVVNMAHGAARGPVINHLTEAEVKKLLEQSEATAKADGLTEIGTVELVAREIAPAIITYADENGYDHIVMGTGDKRGVKRLVLGSVATSVASEAHCSVTVAR